MSRPPATRRRRAGTVLALLVASSLAAPTAGRAGVVALLKSSPLAPY